MTDALIKTLAFALVLGCSGLAIVSTVKSMAGGLATREVGR